MRYKGIGYYAIILAFVAWSVAAFRADIAQIDLGALGRAWHWILLAGGLSLINYLLRIWRWSLYLRRLRHPLPAVYSSLTYIAGFAFTLSPGKVGEMMRGRYLQKAGVPLANTAAAFFAERLMDLLAMVALACLAIGASGYHGLIVSVVVAIVAMLLVLGLTPWPRLADWAENHPRLSPRIKQLASALLRTLVSAKALFQPDLLVVGFLIALVAWGCEGVGLAVIGNISGAATIDVAEAVGVYSIAVIVGALSFLPGGLGSTEAVMVAMLNNQGYPMSDAILLTLVCRLLTLWLAVAIGWLAVLALKEQPSQKVYYMDKYVSTAPLCVDLDGTLIHSDLLLETALLLIKRNPLYLLLFPLWLLQGKAHLKAEIARRVSLNPAALPYNHPFLEWLQGQHHAGRQLWLCTASNYRLADAVVAHLGLFAGVIASSDVHNLSGHRKAAQLTERFGAKAFDYCGNHSVDLAIWQVSHGAVVVNGNERLIQQAETLCPIRTVFPKVRGLWRPLLKATRVHQWAKNVLIFVPLATAHKLGDTALLQQAALAFLAFGCCASSVYLLNDMLDLEADRQHPRKRKRPFAAGKLSLLVGFGLFPLLLVISALLAMLLPFEFRIVLAGYYVLTLAYSFALKRVVLIDTLTLAGLYTVRIIAGAMATQVALSFWLLLFSVFLFLSLALLKRYTELDGMQRQGKLNAVGRGYHIEDLPILHSLGAASGYLCVLVLALYINSPAVEALYRHAQVIWLLCVLLLYWISLVWLKAHRGTMHDDPVVFALKDPVSLAVGVLAAITVYAAT